MIPGGEDDWCWKKWKTVSVVGFVCEREEKRKSLVDGKEKEGGIVQNLFFYDS